MNLQSFSKFFDDAAKYAKVHKPALLQGIGIGGMLAGSLWLGYSTVKAVRLVDKKREELGRDDLTAQEYVETCWKVYLPPVVIESLSAVCLIESLKESNKRNAALTTAYTFSENAMRLYKDKVIETVGEKKEQEIRDKVADEQLKEARPAPNLVNMVGPGEILCYEPITKQVFITNINKPQRIANELNADMISGQDSMGINDLCIAFGIKPDPNFDDVGWNVIKNGRRGLISVSFGHMIEDKGALVLCYDNPPYTNYQDLDILGTPIQ